MLKRQRETVLLQSSSLSSSRRQNLQHRQNQDLSVKPVGCLSGILHLVSKHHGRRRKFLTFGKKQGKHRDIEVPFNSSSSSTTLQFDKEEEEEKEDCGGNRIRHARHLSCQVLRSPTLSVEIRQSDSVISPENFREPTIKDGRSTTTTITTTSTPALVGVDEKGIARSSAEEKRRMLLGALEKCDEDLKAIKNIIEALRVSPGGKNGEKFEACGNLIKELKHSPISVLDRNFTSSPVNLNSTNCFSKRHSISYGQTMQQQKPQPWKKNPRQEDMITTTRNFFHRVTTVGVSVPTRRAIAAWSNKAIGESVVEVCNDVDCGERREVMRVGLILQDCIFRDLLDQVVKELLLLGIDTASNCLYSPLPLEASKKRLRF